MKAPEPNPDLEISCPVVVEQIPNKGYRLEIDASEEERQGLAARFDLLSLTRLHAKVQLKPLAGSTMIAVTGRIQAELAQPCVVSLEPVPQSIDEEFEVEFVPEAQVEHDLELSLEDADPCDPIEDGVIDVGEVISQQLALMLEPYPRADGAALDQLQAGLSGKRKQAFEVDAPSGPFAALAKLKGEDKK